MLILVIVVVWCCLVIIIGVVISMINIGSIMYYYVSISVSDNINNIINICGMNCNINNTSVCCGYDVLVVLVLLLY